MIGTDVLTILFVLFSIILFMGMIGDRDSENRKNFTLGFIVSVAAIFFLNARK